MFPPPQLAPIRKPCSLNIRMEILLPEYINGNPAPDYMNGNPAS